MNGSDDKLHGVWVDVGDDGSIMLPTGVLGLAGLEPGGRCMVRVVDGVLQIMSHTGMAIDIQRMIDKGLDPSRILKDMPGVDGLLVERRREFLMEEREVRAHHDAAE